ncbi:MAG: IS66 family insertion sequence element accessory protein TnpB [Granulosicoccaceae bacterium]
MILLTHDTPILLCVAPSDFRKGIDGLSAVCRLQLAQDPANGTVYLFINRARGILARIAAFRQQIWLPKNDSRY